MTTGDEPDTQHDEDRADQLRNLVILACIAVFVALSYWVVSALEKSNATTACIAAGHHDCVPLDTSGKAP